MTGAQIPRVQVEPARYATDGGDAAQLMAAYGNPLDEWQRRILDCWLGRDAYGHYAMNICRTFCTETERKKRLPGRAGIFRAGNQRGKDFAYSTPGAHCQEKL